MVSNYRLFAQCSAPQGRMLAQEVIYNCRMATTRRATEYISVYPLYLMSKVQEPPKELSRIIKSIRHRSTWANKNCSRTKTGTELIKVHQASSSQRGMAASEIINSIFNTPNKGTCCQFLLNLYVYCIIVEQPKSQCTESGIYEMAEITGLSGRHMVGVGHASLQEWKRNSV